MSTPSLTEAQHWRLAPEFDLDVLLRHLHRTLPEIEAVILLDGSPTLELELFFRHHGAGTQGVEAQPEEEGIARLIPADPDVLDAFADLVGLHAEPEVAIHLLGVGGERAWLEWWDLPSDPLALAGDLPEARVAELARALGTTYTRHAPA